MTTAVQSETFDVRVEDTTATAFDLACSSLVHHLGITETEARAQLTSGQLKLGSDCAALVSLLKALGVAQSPVHEDRVAVSLYSSAPSDRTVTAVSVALLTCAMVDPAQLAQPGGMVLRDLTKVEAQALQHRLRRVHGLSVTLSFNLTARFDIFATTAIDHRQARAISSHLVLIEAVPCRSRSALAANLKHAQVQQILARFPDCGLIAIDRAFQRFDLYLTGIGEHRAASVAEFLSTRADLSGRMVECVTPMNPLQIESGLSNGALRAFRADYAAIGLETSARLSGLK